MEPKEEFQGSIYRFMHFDDLGGLVSIVQEQALTLVHHTKWEDPYEGYIYQAITKPENHEEIRKIIKELNPDTSFAFSMLHDFSSTLFGQSWTKKGEKLWNLYPPNNQGRCVRVQINTENLRKIKADAEWERIRAFEIDYVEEPNLKEELSRCIKGNTISFGHTLLRKRKSEFEHEQEVRLAVMDLDYSLINRRNIAGMINYIQQLQRLIAQGIMPAHAYEENTKDKIRILGKLRTPDIRKVNFAGVDGFIESVMVHPLANAEYVETVQDFCADNGINFLGKATLV